MSFESKCYQVGKIVRQEFGTPRSEEEETRGVLAFIEALHGVAEDKYPAPVKPETSDRRIVDLRPLNASEEPEPSRRGVIINISSIMGFHASAPNFQVACKIHTALHAFHVP